MNQVDVEGVVSQTPEVTEPCAADFLEGKDGLEGAVMKLIAGLLGVNLDELVQHEKQTGRNRRLRANTIAAVMPLLTMVALAAGGIAVWQRNIAEAQHQVAVAVAVAAREVSVWLDSNPMI